MPSALVGGLTAPLRELQAMVGTGDLAAAVALSGIRQNLADVAAAAGRSWQDTRWTGAAADAAADFTDATVAAVESVAARAARLGDASSGAAAAVDRARRRLQEIVDEFEARAAGLESRLDEPGTADELAAEARRALTEANGVLDELRTELAGHRAAVIEPTSAALPTLPMAALPTLAGGLGSEWSSPDSTSRPHVSSRALEEARPSVDASDFGSGIGVHLPDGSTVSAPNAVAASAVRHALTQLGVPYDWGGTTPGVGLDCSGLTQWAYHEAGLDLPRLAQEQDVGGAIERSALRPGDLAVWDGHVAMIVGDGLMIEAGDPVHLSPVRTVNAGQGFQGFWRPTA